MEYWALAGGAILLLTLRERGNTADLFLWQLRFAMLTAVNLTWAARCAVKGASVFEAVPLLFLGNILYILTADDLQTQQMQTIHLYLLILGGAAGALLEGEGWISRFLLFLLLFLVLHLLARRPQSGFGSGDAKVIAALALYFGFSQLFNVLFFSLTVGLLYGLGMILCKKATVKTALPFLPFLLAGTLIGIWL